MATLTEMVEEEAARAEAEPEDENGEAEPEPEDENGEPEAEPETEPAEPEAFAQIGPDEIRKAEKAIEAQRRKLSGILGAEAVAHDCLVCGGLGFVPELPPAGATLAFVETEDGLAVIPHEPLTEPPYIEARDKRACDWCDGYGFVLSGAKADHSRVTPCSKCSGNGWIIKPVEGQAPAPGDGAAPVVVPPGVGDQAGMPPDAWGRPYGHQHWGVPPASIPG